MPSAKSRSVKRQRRIGSWGGRRKGAGRKRELTFSVRRAIANDYFARMQDTPRRQAIIRDLMAKYSVTHRMVERCLAQFLPAIRWHKKMYRHATEGAEIQPLPARKIEKYKPGKYAEKGLR